MMQEHMNVEERQPLGSIPFMLTVSIALSPVIRHFGIISLHHTTNIKQCFFFWYFTVPKFAISQSEANYAVLISYDIKSLT